MSVIYRELQDRRRYTFGAVKETAQGFGNALVERWQWKKGDMLCIFSPNDIDYGVAVYGVLWAGGTIAPANPGYSVKDLAWLLKDASARAIVTQKPLLKVAQDAAREAGLQPGSIILMGEDEEGGPDVHHFKALSAKYAGRTQRPYRLSSDEDLAFLAYSSGTTVGLGINGATQVETASDARNRAYRRE